MRSAAGVWITAFFLAACAAPASPTASLSPLVTGERARQLAEHHLVAGYNEGDYAAWSEQWSTVMTDAISDADFQAVRQQTMDVLGEFRSIQDVSLVPAKTAGFIKYVFTAVFAKGTGTYTLVFAERGDRVEGVTLVPAAAN